jgi:hypothetical protein
LQFSNKFRQNNNLLNRLRLNFPCAHDGAEVKLHQILTSALHREKWTASCPDKFNSKESGPGVYWVGARYASELPENDTNVSKHVGVIII